MMNFLCCVVYIVPIVLSDFGGRFVPGFFGNVFNHAQRLLEEALAGRGKVAQFFIDNRQQFFRCAGFTPLQSGQDLCDLRHSNYAPAVNTAWLSCAGNG